MGLFMVAVSIVTRW